MFLFDIDWLILVDLTCLVIISKNENIVRRTWLIRAQALQILWESVHILTHALNSLCHHYGRQLRQMQWDARLRIQILATTETSQNNQVIFISLCINYINYLTKFSVGSNRIAIIIKVVNFSTINGKSVTALCKFQQNFLQFPYKWRKEYQKPCT